MSEGAAPWPQEIRLAMTMVGGASLAVWMSGVATETAALTRASGPGASEKAWPGYRKLLELLRATVRLDVLTGTSAGGIGAAGLGLAEAVKSSPAPLRDALLSAVSLEELIRDPNEKQPRSLLDGDRLLGDLEGAFSAISASGTLPEEPPDVTLLLPATMLDGETVHYSDALGNLVRDTEHRMMFRFDGPLWTNRVTAPLALAARSTASFPGAFELSRLPVGAEHADRLHPDMTDYTALTRSHWLTDGGVLVNKPLRPALREIFERSSAEDVRRLLLYVVPTVESDTAEPCVATEEATTPVDPADPPSLGTGLARIASTIMNQTISADLEELAEHNDAVAATRHTRVSLAALGIKSGALVDNRVLAAYLDQRVAEDAAELVRTATRYYALSAPGAPGPQWSTGRSRDLRSIAVRELKNGIPDTVPPARCRPGDVEVYRTMALDDSVAVGLQLLNAAFHLFPDQRQAKTLNDVRSRLHAARRKAARGVRLGPWIARHEPPPDGTALPDWVAQLAREWAELGESDALREAWPLVTAAFRDTAPVLKELVAEPPGKAVMAAERELPAGLGRALANATDAVTTFAEWFGLSGSPVSEPELLSKLLLLHIATRGLLAQSPSVDQRVDLVQVSADSRTLLDLSRQRSRAKLTGLQADYFGAFYKGSWRANDWMWGRVDAAGWLMQCLLDPHRLRVLRNVLGPEAFRDEVREAFKAVGWALPSLADNAPADEIKSLQTQLGEELAFLGLDAELADVEFTDDLPASLPVTSMVLARGRQLEIAREELPVVAQQATADAVLGNGKPSAAFRRAMAASPETAAPQDSAAIQRAFQACRVSAERFDDERGTMLLTKTLVKAGATGVNALASATRVPKSLQPAATVAQAVGRSAWWITQGATRLGRPWNLLAAAVTALAGLIVGGTGGEVLQWVGPPVAAGAVVFLLVSLLTLKRTWRMVLTLVCVLVVLALLFAAFLPPLAHPLFGWLGTLVAGWQRGQAPVWWLLVVLLLVLPAVWTPVAGLRRRPRPRGKIRGRQ